MCGTNIFKNITNSIIFLSTMERLKVFCSHVERRDPSRGGLVDARSSDMGTWRDQSNQQSQRLRTGQKKCRPCITFRKPRPSPIDRGNGSRVSRPRRDPRTMRLPRTAATNVVQTAASRPQSHSCPGTCMDASSNIIGYARLARPAGPAVFIRCWSRA
jgi:hypothetical protein